MTDFWFGIGIGWVFGLIVGVVGMACSVAAGKREEAHEQAQRFMAWADTAEFNDAARAFNDRRVRENRRAVDQSPPHTLALMRDEHDRKHGGSW